jgi:tRNA dimethylallyltransferase
VPTSTSNNKSEAPEVSPETSRIDDSTVPGAPKIVVIAGPTASGKTRLGIELALRFNGEVVNADSRYLYRGMDIGVAKPTMEERRGVPHHLIDILDPVDDMSLALYQSWAAEAIKEIAGRGRLPLVVGGTPLYVNALIEGWRIPRVPPDPAYRAEMERLTPETLLARLAEVDPIAAERSGPNLRRVIRALEIYDATGIPMSAQEGRGPRPFETLELGLELPRELLYEAVDRRVDDQIARGLLEEVRSLLASGVPESAPALSSLGYRQLIPVIHGTESLESAIQTIKHDTHKYVRHQQTWLKRNRRLVPIDVTQPDWIKRAAALVYKYVNPE